MKYPSTLQPRTVSRDVAAFFGPQSPVNGKQKRGHQRQAVWAGDGCGPYPANYFGYAQDTPGGIAPQRLLRSPQRLAVRMAKVGVEYAHSRHFSLRIGKVKESLGMAWQ